MFVILLFFLAVFLIYAYINHNGEFTATASAIRQIWSGSCRLSCRQSEFSSFSGLSGLPAPGTSADPGTSHKPYNRPFCVCETCPCALIDDILSKWRPVTSFYNDALNFLSSYFCGILQALNDTSEYFTRVANCGASCQRQAQLLGPKQLDSSQNICFGNPSRKSRSESRMQGVKALLLRRKSTTVAAEEKQESSEDEDDDPQKPMSSNIIESAEHPTVVQTKSCSKCIEKGYTCMKNCPRSKKN